MGAERCVVTGALGYTGRYIARALLARGTPVTTLVAHPDRPNPFGDQIRIAPFNFDQPAALAESLRGAATLYNTYWVRFNRGGVSFDQAVANTRILLRAAAEAGVRRFVQISVSQAALAPRLPYFRGKLEVEDAVRQSGLSYAIVRPTLIFAEGDILLNNIAWLLRRFPVFAVPGAGDYRVQPVAAEDVADIALNAGQPGPNVELDAAGPGIYRFDELVRRVARAVGSAARLIHTPPGLALAASSLVGLWVGDVVLTRDEVAGLMANLLVSDDPPTGQRRLEDWLQSDGPRLGMRYASELARHFRAGT
jgi:uncharacterized protein YbjT (DUF2867 family)